MKKVDPDQLQNLREEYSKEALDLKSVHPDPIIQFDHWLHAAIESGIPEPNAMTLATVNAEGHPDARIVLLKGFDADGFVFFTNYESDKGRQLTERPQAALVFSWLELQRQIRIRGLVERVSESESTSYFQSRPRGSQLGGWASPQSRAVANRMALEQRLEEMEERFADQDPLPRPDHWGGFRVIPRQIEFWQGRENRLHDRILFIRESDDWARCRLAP